MTRTSKTLVAIAASQSNPEAIDQDRRRLLTGAALGLAAAGAASLFPARPVAAAADDAIRPFHIDIPEADLVDLRRRLAATRWSDKETVNDDSQGVPQAMLRDLVRYWQTDYDWRKVEARLNALPQFITEIDGLDIHFIHVRSKHGDALPMIVTHGWPGSVIEQMKIIEPLTNPTSHGGSASDAFHLVIPSMPGYGFSGKPTTVGWDSQRIARAWVQLMKRLGYSKFVAQGGDWGSPVSNEMAKLGAPELLGIHVNLPGVVPPEVFKAVSSGGPAPDVLSAEEQHAFEQIKLQFAKRRAYAQIMGTRPQSLAAFADSPAGLAAWLLDHGDGPYRNAFLRLLLGHVHVDPQVVQLAGLAAVFLVHDVNGLLADHAQHVPAGRKQADALAHQHLRIPATHAQHADVPLVVHVRHDQSNFVQVTHQGDAGRTFGADLGVGVPVVILVGAGKGACFL